MKLCRVCTSEIPHPNGTGVGKRGRTTYCSEVCRKTASTGGWRRKNPAPRKWGTDNVTYMGAHTRVRTTRGPASDHICECGARADDWSYNLDCPREKVELHKGYLLAYSPDPFAYTPRCRKCHSKFDAA